jgi:hypothetical protein
MLCHPATAATPPAAAPDDAYCSVAVNDVAPIGAGGTTQGVVMMPTVDGSGTLSGTIALFTADNRRYDVPFPDTPISSTGTPAVLVYKFARPVEVTGAYVATLGGANAGPCAIAYPWSKIRSTPAARAVRAIASVPANAPATAVAEPGTPAPLACSDPDHPPHTISAALIRSIPYAHGHIGVMLYIQPDGRPTDPSIASFDPSVNDGGTGNDARADAIRAAMLSTFAPATFRCRPIVEPYDFVLLYN